LERIYPRKKTARREFPGKFKTPYRREKPGPGEGACFPFKKGPAEHPPVGKEKPDPVPVEFFLVQRITVPTARHVV
jgi:hypothetical protein